MYRGSSKFRRGSNDSIVRTASYDSICNFNVPEEERTHTRRRTEITSDDDIINEIMDWNVASGRRPRVRGRKDITSDDAMETSSRNVVNRRKREEERGSVYWKDTSDGDISDRTLETSNRNVANRRQREEERGPVYYSRRQRKITSDDDISDRNADREAGEGRSG